MLAEQTRFRNVDQITRAGLVALLLTHAFYATGQTNYLETDAAIRELLIRVADRQLVSDATNRTPRTLADGSDPVATTLTQAQAATRPSGIQWDYPWGVNLYGLMQAYRATGNTNYLNFVRDHNLIVGRHYFWLRSLHNSLTSTSGLSTFQLGTAMSELFKLDRLDFCGSMTSQLMEGVLWLGRRRAGGRKSHAVRTLLRLVFDPAAFLYPTHFQSHPPTEGILNSA
jgi:hypothetical protein